MDIGIDTFVERRPDARTGRLVSAAQRVRDLLEEAELADQIGLDVFGVGWPPPTRGRFDAERSPHGAPMVGDPHEVIDKILFEHDLFHHQRFLMQMSVGTMPHEKIMRSIELLGTVVAPAVRRELAARAAVRDPDVFQNT